VSAKDCGLVTWNGDVTVNIHVLLSRSRGGGIRRSSWRKKSKKTKKKKQMRHAYNMQLILFMSQHAFPSWTERRTSVRKSFSTEQNFMLHANQRKKKISINRTELVRVREVS